MAVVIPFRSARANRRSTLTASQPGRSAEILFFTGVRYERQAETPVQPRPAALRRANVRPRKRVKQQA